MKKLLAVLILTVTLVPLAQAKTVYVNKNTPGTVHNGTSWATAFTSVQPAIDAAKAGDEVWVAAGKYQGATGKPVATLQSGVGLSGGFAGWETSRAQRDWRRNETVLDGAQQIIPVVSVPDGAPATTILDGFTVQNGRMHGICCDGSTDMVIRNNRITGNNAVYINNPPPGASRFQPGGGIYIYHGSPSIIGNAIIGNTASGHGGGMKSEGSPYIAGNLFLRNSAGWMYALDVDAPAGATFAVVNNTFISNGKVGWMSAIQIGGWKPGSPPNNITFANNLMAFGSSVNAHVGSVSIRNNCFWGNYKDFYDSVPDQTGLNGNIKVNPQFFSFGDDDFRLRPGSPCIDAGFDSVVAPSEIDLAGLPRIYGSHVDIGAYEWQPLAPWSVAVSTAVSGGVTVADRIAYVAGNDGRLYARYTEDGSSVHGFPVDINAVVGETVKLPSRPAVYYGKTGKAIYLTTDRGDVLRILPNGAVAWHVRPVLGQTVSTPAVTPTGEVFVNLSTGVGPYNNYVFKLDEATGIPKTLSPFLGYTTADDMGDYSPAANSRYLYVNAGWSSWSGLTVLNQDNMMVRSSFAAGEQCLSPLLLGSDLILASKRGKVYKMNAVTLSPDMGFGHFGVADIGGQISAAPFADGAGNVYLGTADGRILKRTAGSPNFQTFTTASGRIAGLTINRAAGVLGFGTSTGSFVQVPLDNPSGAVTVSPGGPISTGTVYEALTDRFIVVTDSGMLSGYPSVR